MSTIINTEKLNTVGLNTYAHRMASISDRYRPIDTESLVTSVVRDIGLNATVESVAGRGSKSTKHAVVLTLDSTVLLANTACFPRIYVRNSYAGESALTVRVGFYRLICSNGMMVGTTHFNGRLLHLDSGIKQLPQLRHQIRDAVQWCTRDLPVLAERLNNIVLSPVQVSTILSSIKASQRLAETVSLRLHNPRSLRPEDRGVDINGQYYPTAWTLWNIVNEAARQRSRSPLRQLDVNSNLLEAIEETIAQAA